MLCPSCGQELPDNTNYEPSYCNYCGAAVVPKSEQFAMPVPAAEPTNTGPAKLQFGKLLGDTFDLYRINFGTMCMLGCLVAGVYILFWLGSFGTGLAARMTNNETSVFLLLGLDFFIQIAGSFVNGYISLGILRQCLFCARGGTGCQTHLLFPPFMMFLKAIGISLIICCAVFAFYIPIGCFLGLTLAMPVLEKTFPQFDVLFDVLFGFWFLAIAFAMIIGLCAMLWIMIRWIFTMVFLADQNTGVIDSLTYSWRTAAGNFWRLLWASIVLMLITWSGMLIFFVGIIFTAAVYQLGLALAYLQLTGQPNCFDYPPQQHD